MMKKLALLMLVFLFTTTTAAASDPFGVAANVTITPEKLYSIPVYEDGVLNFNAEMLEQRLGIALEGITVTSLPDPLQGRLLLDSKEVKTYEYIPRAALERLHFIPQEGAGAVRIGIIPQAPEAIPASIQITVLSSPNMPPSAENTSVNTVPGVAVKGFINTIDPENDTVEIKLIEKPQKGAINLDGVSFSYHPYPGMTGIDRFNFCVVDSVGNYSAVAAIEVSIEENDRVVGFRYVDMATNPSHYAAIKLHQNGIFSGRQFGEQSFFFAERMMPRSDYLMMMLAASGRSPTPCVNTGLPNDAELPTWLKPYVKAGLDTGILSAEEEFIPDNSITRAEAVVWCDRAAGILDVKEYPLTMSDADNIPEWARQSYIDLAAYRMLDLYDGKARPYDPLTNDFAADLTWQLFKYYENQPFK